MLTDYHKQELENSMLKMMESFKEEDPTKVFFSKESIKDVLTEYGYEKMRKCYYDCVERQSEEQMMLLFQFSNRVVEREFNKTLEYMAEKGMGEYVVDDKGEILFTLTEKGKNYNPTH